MSKTQISAILAKYDLAPVDPSIQIRKDQMLTDHDDELTKFRQINTNVEKYLKTLNKELVQVKVEKLKLENDLLLAKNIIDDLKDDHNKLKKDHQDLSSNTDAKFGENNNRLRKLRSTEDNDVTDIAKTLNAKDKNHNQKEEEL